MIEFSILVVALNPKEDLVKTLSSIQSQSYTHYEVVIKDGGSKQESIDIRNDYLHRQNEFSKKVRIIEQEDKSIYDAMNQAIKVAKGKFIIFLNCGDAFYDESVLQMVSEEIDRYGENQMNMYYGNVYHELSGEIALANPNFTAFASYRNMPCHQACIYHKELFKEHLYHIEYKVRADYEHFLWVVFQPKLKLVYVPLTIAAYQGGGFSETKENQKRAQKEHKAITSRYYSKRQRFFYQGFLVITLAPIRKKIAESKKFSTIYQKLVKQLYKNRW